MPDVFNFSNIRVVHLEPTTNCNAACPQCLRTRTTFAEGELSLNDIKVIFTSDVLLQLEKIYMCGNYGDPAAAKETLEMFEYFKSINSNITIGMNSNGGLRSTYWWRRLAEIMSGSKDYVVFSIDGLSDTNHIYRQNVRWSKLMNNVQAFINNGGNAHWDMLVFDHNKHQIQDIRNFAKELGFKWFRAKVSRRFKRFPVEGLSKPLNFIENKIETGKIKCNALIENSMYIDAHGRFIPCCWQAEGNYQNNIKQWFYDLSESWNAEPNSICKRSCLASNNVTTFNGQWRYEEQLN